MARLRSTSLASALGILASVASLAIGCALGAQEDVGSDVDPKEPQVDASFIPQPAMPSASETDPNQADRSTSGGSPAAVSNKAPDAGPTSPRPTQGEVLVTEVLFDPTTPEPASEWIEVYNTTKSARSLSGLTLVDGSGRTHVIGAGVELAAGKYGLLVRNRTGATAAKVPAAAILYEYGTGQDDFSGILLTNGATGGVKLRDGATDIAQAVYGGWFTAPLGRSVELASLFYSAALAKSGWCQANVAWTSGSDKGTPGAPNDCP